MTLRTTLTAAVTAAALALGAPAPAIAGPDKNDILKLLAGAAVVGLIAREVQRNGGLGQGLGQGLNIFNPAPQYNPPVQRAPVFRDPVIETPRRPVRNTYSSVLPAECALEYQGRQGWSRVYGANCLADTGFRTRLPEYCAMDIRTSRGERVVYEESCLREAGFRAGSQRY